ncbi:hypothetical protein acdb102_23060 [Acidothermaceae bacterium B102]|nr:hypothetical protein acdb102_23060 [Acidothermaceae bacterium B102]
MPLDTSSAPSAASPLWIIALFIALSEATAGVASVTTNGVTQLIFAIFAVAFPSIVFLMFVRLLIKHTPKLYAPGQYTGTLTPQVFADGVNGRETLSPDLSLLLGSATLNLVEAAVSRRGAKFEVEINDEVGIVDSVDATVRQPELTEDEERSRLLDVWLKTVNEGTIFVDLSDFKFNLMELVPMTDATTVRELIDRIGGIIGLADPMAYGAVWVFENRDGYIYSEMGPRWAVGNGQADDMRALSAVNITAETKLKVRRWTPQGGVPMNSTSTLTVGGADSTILNSR